MNRGLPIFDWAFSQPDKESIVADTSRRTWGELRDAVLRAAAVLRDRVYAGTRVALVDRQHTNLCRVPLRDFLPRRRHHSRQPHDEGSLS